METLKVTKWSKLPDITQLICGQTWACIQLFDPKPLIFFFFFSCAIRKGQASGLWRQQCAGVGRFVAVSESMSGPLLFPLQSLGQSPAVPVKVMLLGKLPSVFIFAADFHLSLWTWMFPDPGIFKQGYLSFLIMGCLHFPCVLFVSLVVWCRGLEWEG